ncbi:uncharacterized protein LOC108112198 [Drosophila eugracilis]|uniref:uncharacterized protein LOC108112198 n=1 Tax=Drosophila eugracilis TaxID=29029 RepID=UPI0007E78591|nr:uncharacterized protein LOC108112198 [Drosophila eugracilis]
MRLLWLLLLIACGSVQFPGVLTLPEALPGKSLAAAGGGNGGGSGAGTGGVATVPTTGDSSKDYDYDDEDSQQRAPGNLAKSTAATKIPEPYFDQTEVNIYVPKNATSVKLECPVKNYNADKHVILWYKEKVMVTSGNNIINNIYGLDNKFTLTVPLDSNTTENRYECSVANHAKRQVTIHFGPEPITTPAPSVNPVSAVTSAPAKDSAPHGRDISLWLLGLFLAPLQLAVSFRF